jgi:hypothetical protein
MAGDADGRLHLGEAWAAASAASRQQRRVLLQVRGVSLIRGNPPGAQLLQREHQLHRVEHSGDPGQPRRRQAAGEVDEVGTRGVDVDEAPSDLPVVERGGLLCRGRVDAPLGHEVVDHVPLVGTAAVELDDGSVADLERRLRVVGAVRGDEAEFREGLDQYLAPELALGTTRVAGRALVSGQGAPAARRRPARRGRTPR